MAVQNLEEFFSGYASYHHNPVNKAIHIVCIPLILTSLFQLLQHAPFRIDTPILQITLPFILAMYLSSVYIRVDFISGIISTVLYTSACLYGTGYFNSLKSQEEKDHHFQIALVVHVVSWLLQFIGHGFFEKRAPALLDNLFQTAVAPDFVVLELLFMFGYKPDTKRNCEQRISENISAFRKLHPRKDI